METIIVGNKPSDTRAVVKVMKKAASYANLFDQWKEWARELDIPEEKINQLRIELASGKVSYGDDCLNQLLLQWKSLHGRQFNLVNLYEALKKANFDDVAETLKEEFMGILREKFVYTAEIEFQDNITTIKKLLDTGDDTDTLQSIHNYISDNLLRKMKEKVTVKLVTDTIPVTPRHYISRNLTGRTRLHPDVFKMDNKDDVFVINGLQWCELTELAGGNSTDVSSNQTRNVNVRFILLEDDSHFYAIGNLTHNPVHLISLADNKFYWINSFEGRLGIIQRFIHEEQTIFPEIDFTRTLLQEFDAKSVCIGDTPGMGKTILLANIAMCIRREYPSRLTIFFVLGELAPELSKSMTMDAVAELVCRKCSRNSLGTEIVKQLIVSKRIHVELFLDGYDEVLPSQIESVRQFFTTIRQFSNIRVHVTTRPHLLEELEQSLGLLGYQIMPFTEENQLDFLCKFWISKYGAEDTLHLSRFSQSCLTNLKQNMKDNEKDIAGVPLQCTLLAEVCASDAVDASKGIAKFRTKINVRSLFDMYYNLMTLKFKRIEEEHERIKKDEHWLKRFWRTIVNDKYPKEKVLNFHVSEAIRLLFPSQSEEFKKLFEVNDTMIQRVLSVGIMETTPASDRPRFVHRTFAEYLIAQFLVRGIRRDESCLKLLFGTVLGKVQIVTENSLGVTVNNYNFQYPVISYFVDRHLEMHNVKSVDAIRLAKKSNIWNGKEILIACAANGLQNCFQLVRETLLFPAPFDATLSASTFSPSLLLSATKFSKNEDILKDVLDFTKGYDPSFRMESKYSVSSKLKFSVTPLHLAVQAGSYKLTEVFLNSDICNLKNVKCLLHACVHQTVADDVGMLNQKKQIIKLLLRKDKNKLEEKLPVEGSTPLLQPHIHIELLKCLLEQKADVNTTDMKGNTFLHLALRRRDGRKTVSPEMYTELFQLLIQFGFENFYCKNDDGRTFLHQAVEYIMPEDAVLQHVSSRNLCNVPDTHGNSVLFVAILSGKSKHFIRKLAYEYNCELDHVNANNQTALHIAAKFGNVEAVSFLIGIGKLNTSINHADKSGNTPLHLAMLQMTRKFVRVQEILLQYTANILARNKSGKSPLELALRQGYGASFEIFSKMQSILNFTKNTAGDCLNYLIQNNKIRAKGLGSDFAKLFRYFHMEKGGLVQTFRGKQITTKTKTNWLAEIREEIAKVTDVSEELIEKLEVQVTLPVSPSLLYEHVICHEIPIERVMLALLETNQLTAFYLLRNLFQWSEKSVMFVSSPKGIDAFVDSNKKVLVIKSLDLEVCKERILETIPDAMEFNQHSNSISPDISVCVNTIANLSIQNLEFVEDEPHKFVIICETCDSDVNLKYSVLDDEMDWADLMPDFQRDIQQKLPEKKNIENLKGNDLVSIVKLFMRS